MKYTIRGQEVVPYWLHDTPPVPKHQQQLVQANNKYRAIVDTGNILRGTVIINIFLSPETQLSAFSQVGMHINNHPLGMWYGYVDPPPISFEWYGANGVSDEENLYATNPPQTDKIVAPSTIEESKTKITYHVPLDEFSDPTPRNQLHGSVIVHEFMHALGAVHEHQNTKGVTMNFNKQKVYEWMCCNGEPEGSPNCKKISDECKQEAQINILDRYNCDDPLKRYTCESDFDPDSIMLYGLSDNMFTDGKNPTKYNYVLSKSDEDWLKKYYPTSKPVNEWPFIIVRFPLYNNVINGEYYVYTEEQWYKDTWKRAWIQKVIHEQLMTNPETGTPRDIGIRFYWSQLNNKNPANVAFGVKPVVSMSIEHIIAIVLSCIAGLYIIWQIFRYFVPPRTSDTSATPSSSPSSSPVL